MTREEAIKQLDAMWKMLTSAYDDIADSHVAAYTMAVDALKAQGTCEDAVSRQTLQKELALYPIDDVTSEDEAGYNRAINDVQKMVLHLPSAQPERNSGKWVRRLVDSGFNADWHCSECGWKTCLEEHGYNFCPNCGAYMKGEQNED